jgi:ABC-type sugar transport system substrate-binding protein
VTASEAAARKKRVGLFLISDRTGYQRLQAEEGRNAAQKTRLELEVFSADDTAAQQSVQIVRFLHAHPQEQLAVVVMPVADIGHEQAIESLARKVLSQGVAWLVLNRDLAAHVLKMRAEFPQLPVGLITIDNHEVGRIQGRQVRALLAKNAGTVLCVLGNALTSAARDRRAGLLEILTSAVPVSEVEAMWSADSAGKVVARWLTSAILNEGSLAVVACQNDPMAVGARETLHRLAQERNRPEWMRVPVLGVDGLPTEGQRLVDQRTLAGTVVLPATAGQAIELLARAWHAQAAIAAKLVLQPRPYPS